MGERKIPTTPAALAASLVYVAGSTLDGIEKHAGDTALPPTDKLGTLGEITCAYYCLAITVLGVEELAAEPGVWNLYTSATYEELKKLAAETEPCIVSDKLMEEAVELYIHDNPNLAELANRMPEFSLGEEVRRAAATDDWFISFMTKAHIHVCEKLAIRKSDFSYLPVWYSISASFLEYAKAFRQIRPVLVEEAP